MQHFKDLPSLSNDGLPIAEVGAWSEEKYRLIQHYASLFCRAMRGKWGSLVYLDIFAGPGHAKFKGTNRIVAASPMIALGLEDKFDEYIFCEAESANAMALEKRCARDHPKARVHVVNDDANKASSQLLQLIPPYSKSNTVLCFCFVDPYKMANLQFKTIETLAKRFMDFLILIPSGMDTHRNEKLYVASSNRTIEEFSGNPDWRTRWQPAKDAGVSFENFIVEELGRSMRRLKYNESSLQDAAPIRSHAKNLLLYRLAFYSKNKLGNKFWMETRKYTNPQAGFEGF